MLRIKKILCALSLMAFLSFVLAGCNEEKKASKSSDVASMSNTVANQQVNVYSARLPDLVKPIFDAFTKETKIKVNFIFLKQGIIERLKSEKEFTPADLILVSDIGTIHDILKTKLVQPIKSDIVAKNIPAHYRSKKNLWVGLTGRVRLLVRSLKDLPITDFNYDALSDPKMKGRVCTRSLLHPYNVSLVASYLQLHGSEKAETWLKGFYSNLFDKPSGNDSGQIKLIASGVCDLAPINHYYYERMLQKDKDLKNKATLVPIKDMQNGVYANVSGIMLSQYAQNQQNALKLIEFMTKQKAQKIFSEYDLEFPLNPHVASQSDIFKDGIDNIITVPLDDIAQRRQDALTLIYKIINS